MGRDSFTDLLTMIRVTCGWSRTFRKCSSDRESGSVMQGKVLRMYGFSGKRLRAVSDWAKSLRHYWLKQLRHIKARAEQMDRKSPPKDDKHST